MKHKLSKPELDHQRGGWVISCSCGWTSKRPHWYRKEAAGDAIKHREEASKTSI